MERATVYRAISAPTALVGGLLAIGLAAFVITLPDAPTLEARADWHHVHQNVAHYAAVWVAVLIVTLFANAAFIWRKARRERSSFSSPGLRLAARCALPPVLVAAFLTIFIVI